MRYSEHDNTGPWPRPTGRHAALRGLWASVLLCVLVGVGVRPTPASASPRNARLAGVSSFAFGIGDGMLAGDVARRFAGYDLVIVDGDLVTRRQVATLRASGAIVLGYLDVGTIEAGRPWYRDVARYRMELWGDWGEWYADVRQLGFQRVITRTVAPQMLAKGLDGLFLDNTDMVETHRRQAVGMRRLVERLARLAHGRGGLLFAQNGEGSIGPLLPWLDGWNREDLTATYDFASRRYARQTRKDIAAGQAALRRVGAAGLLTMATDYTSTEGTRLTRLATAHACAAGALSFVSDIELTRMPAVPPTCAPAARTGAIVRARHVVTVPTCRGHTHLVLASPGAGHAYAAAYPNFSDDTHNEDGVTIARIDAFEQRVGRPIAWSYFSNHWVGGHVRFPRTAVLRTWRHGELPFVRMMPWSRQVEGSADPVFRMRDIANGRWDAQLVAWARAARATHVPIMVDFGVEMNGDWFPWNGRYQGGPGAGPAAYRDAYRHIVTLFRRQAARNVSFAFHIDADGQPAAAWNAAANYYPGDRYVDWLGASVYGAVDTGDDWEAFPAKLQRAYDQLTALSPTRPLAVFEWGVVESPAKDSKAAWINEAFTALATGFPRISAISWWNERWQQSDGHWDDTTVDSDPGALAAYRAGIADPRYVDRPAFRCARG